MSATLSRLLHQPTLADWYCIANDTLGILVTARLGCLQGRGSLGVAQQESDIQYPVKFRTRHANSCGAVFGAVIQRRPLLEPPLSELGAVADCRRRAEAYGMMYRETSRLKNASEKSAAIGVPDMLWTKPNIRFGRMLRNLDRDNDRARVMPFRSPLSAASMVLRTVTSVPVPTSMP